jgi:hypothetical protein
MLGYPQGVKGYRLLDLDTRQIFVSRDVIFYENSFPFHTSQHSIPLVPTTTSMVLPSPINDMSIPLSPISFDIDSNIHSSLHDSRFHSPTPSPLSTSHNPNSSTSLVNSTLLN